MRKHLLTLALLTTASLGHAQNLQPQMLMGLLGGMGGAGGMASSLSPQQTAAVANQVQTIANQTFTPAERAKLTEFQNSPEGQSIIAKLPQFTQAVAPVLMQAYMGQMLGGGLAAPAAPAPVAPVKPSVPPLKLSPSTK